MNLAYLDVMLNYTLMSPNYGLTYQIKKFPPPYYIGLTLKGDCGFQILEFLKHLNIFIVK